jgi:CRP-like cAMP-binding protein
MKKLDIGATELGVLAHMLRKVEFFTPLTVGQLEQVLPSVMLYSYDTGETVFSQGQKGDAFYIVYKGSVDILLRRWLVLSKKIATLKEGDFLGEIALISDEPRTATVAAAEPTLLFTLIADDFKFVLAENPAAAEEMKRIGARRKFASDHKASS